MFYELLMAKARKQKQQDHIELEYLESTGTQWINLNRIPTAETGLYIKVSTVGQGDMIICGSRNDSTTHTRLYLSSTYSSNNQREPLISIGRGTYMYLQLDGSLVAMSSDLKVPFNTIYEQYTNYNNSKVTKFVDSTRTITSTTIQELTFTPNYPLYLFAGNITGTPNYFYQGRIYRCEITEGDKLVMDLIPVLDKNLVSCMYDKVSGKYFYNEGTGEFKWKLPNQLEYLESDGNQYLLTDYYPNPNTAVEVDYLPSENYTTFTCIFGTQNGAQSNRFYTVISSTKYRLQVNAYRGNVYYGLNTNGTVVQGNNGDFTSNRERVLLKLDCFNKTISIKSDSYTNTYDMSNKFWGDCNCSYPLVIFARSSTGVIPTDNRFNGRIYSFKIWESDKLLHYYIPVYDKTLTPCMYDLVSKKYFYNNGTGQFKGYFEDGSQVVSYLESTGTQYIDTGLIANQLIDKTLYIKMKNTGNSGNYAYNGAYDISGTGLTIQFGLFATSDTQCRTTQNYFDPSYSQTTGLDKSLFYELQMDKTTYWLNGEVVGTHTQTDEEKIKTCVNPFLIFGRSQKNASNSITPMVISRFWIKNADGSYLQNLFPVLKSDNTACMYDLVSKKYFVNQGFGSFTCGTQVNLFDPTKPSYVAGYISTNNNITSSTLTDTFYIPCKPNTTYLVKRTSYKEANQVWRVATIPTVPTVDMSIPHYVGGLINDLYLVIKSRDTDKYLLFSEGRTLHTDDLSKFTVLEIEDNNSLIGS